jgi:DNA-binding protein H-NS
MAEKARSEVKADMILQIKGLMAAHDVRLSDLGTPRSKTSRAASAPRAAGAKVNPLAGRKVPAKYADTAGNSWSGRGLQPKWLRDSLASGASLASFAVTA